VDAASVSLTVNSTPSVIFFKFLGDRQAHFFSLESIVFPPAGIASRAFTPDSARLVCKLIGGSAMILGVC